MAVWEEVPPLRHPLLRATATVLMIEVLPLLRAAEIRITEVHQLLHRQVLLLLRAVEIRIIEVRPLPRRAAVRRLMIEVRRHLLLIRRPRAVAVRRLTIEVHRHRHLPILRLQAAAAEVRQEVRHRQVPHHQVLQAAVRPHRAAGEAVAEAAVLRREDKLVLN